MTQTLGRDLEKRKVDDDEDHQDLLHHRTVGDETEVGLETGSEVTENQDQDHRENTRKNVNIIIIINQFTILYNLMNVLLCACL